MKKIANLTNLVNSVWKRIVISISVVFLITVSLAYRANIFSISDWLQFLILWALGVVAVFSLYDLIHGERDRAEQKKANELRVINTQLLEVYQPMEYAIIDFLNKLPSNTSDINNINELELALKKIKSNTIYEIDSRTNNFQTIFFGTRTKSDLENIFLNRVQEKITELKTERRKYE